MCGINGIINIYQSSLWESNVERYVKVMNSTLSHRGPDGSGLYKSSNLVCFGHTRLSIIDLSQSANQPMSCKEQIVTITFNGEIYNFEEIRSDLTQKGYVFNTRSDTEVIIALYKLYNRDGFEKLEGIFAFALYDRALKRVFIYRDRLGIKPLYFCKSQVGFAFSSEISPLMTLPGVNIGLNEQALSEYIWFGNSVSDQTIFSGIQELPPGGCIEIHNGAISSRAWWKLEDWLPRHEDLLERKVNNSELLQCIDDAVRRQSISDVPVGMFLSGGIDSGSVAASLNMLGLSSSVNAMTARFSHASKTDVEGAQEVAFALGFNHDIFDVNLGDDLINTIEHLACAHAEPFADAANIPLYLMCKSVHTNRKVVLQGDGGDELFGGYNRHALLSGVLGKAHNAGLAPFFGVLSKVAPRRLKRILSAFAERESGALSALLLTLDTRQNSLSDIFTTDYKNHLEATTDPFLRYLRNAERFKEYSPVKQQTLIDLSLQLPKQFLKKVDIASMAAGVEARVPLLDENVLKYSLASSDISFVNHGKGKYLIYQSQVGRLPKSSILRKKRGFGVPYGSWIDGPLKEYVRDKISSRSFTDNFNIDRVKMDKIMIGDYGNNPGAAFKVWKLLQLSLYQERLKNYANQER